MSDTQDTFCCSLTPDAKADRIAWARRRLVPHARLREALNGGGLRLGFTPGGAMREALRQFVALEEECCGFLEFRLDEAGDLLILEITGPPAARATLREFADLAAVG